MFKKMRGIKLPYRKQGLVYFLCVNYADMPEETRRTIDRLCAEVGGEYECALRCVVTGEKTVFQAAQECPCDETTLYRRRNEFYSRFEQELKKSQDIV